MTIEIAETDSATASPADALQPAGFWIRALARILDQVMLGIAGLFVGAILAVVAYATEDMTGRSGDEMLVILETSTFISWIGNFAATVVYHALFESVSGNTVGKRMLGLHVVSMDGSPIRFRQGLIRSVAFFVDALFLAAVAALAMHESPVKQRVGDKWADTRVVKRRSLPLQMHPPTLQFFAGLVGAMQSAAAIVAITMTLEILWHLR